MTLDNKIKINPCITSENVPSIIKEEIKKTDKLESLKEILKAHPLAWELLSEKRKKSWALAETAVKANAWVLAQMESFISEKNTAYNDSFKLFKIGIGQEPRIWVLASDELKKNPALAKKVLKKDGMQMENMKDIYPNNPKDNKKDYEGKKYSEISTICKIAYKRTPLSKEFFSEEIQKLFK